MKILFLTMLSLVCLETSAQQKNETLTVDGLKRQFITYLPAGYSANDKLPIVISLHGRLGTAERQIKFADFRPIADKEKFIIVCPQGIDRSWNDGRGTPAHDKGINDIKFMDELVTYILKTYHGDASRVYLTGMSNGGFMSSRLACELSERIAAIAVVGASMDRDAGYGPLSAMPVMYIQGTKDPLVPFAGGAMKKGAGGEIYGHEEVLKKWAAMDNCGKLTTTDLPIIKDDGTTVTKEEYSGPGGVKVVGYTINGGGHTWPDGTQYLPKMIIGSLSHNLDACQVIWEFFKLHSLGK